MWCITLGITGFLDFSILKITGLGITGFLDFSILKNAGDHNVSETGCFRLQVWRYETLTLFGPLERTDLNHWTLVPLPHLRTETSSFRNVMFYIVL
jgi:hypothetical protein